jgi:iron complex outermembrane receptor protein
MKQQRVFMLKPIVVSISLAFSGFSFADIAPAADADSTALSLGEVVVTSNGGPLSTQKILTSVNIVPVERLEDKVVSSNWQLFDQVPGVMLTQFGQGTSSGKLSMGGSTARGRSMRSNS